jgi:transposase InsO family protein
MKTSWPYIQVCFKSLVRRLENETGNKVQTLHTNQGGEYISKVFSEFLNEKDIKHEYIVRFTPQQNGVAERGNRTLMEMTRCMHLPPKIWFDGI